MRDQLPLPDLPYSSHHGGHLFGRVHQLHDAARRIRCHPPAVDTIRILVVDDHRLFAEAVAVRLAREPDFVDQLEEAVRRGATGWLPKTVDGDELVRAVRGVARGQGWIPHDLLGGLLERL